MSNVFLGKNDNFAKTHNAVYIKTIVRRGDELLVQNTNEEFPDYVNIPIFIYRLTPTPDRPISFLDTSIVEVIKDVGHLVLKHETLDVEMYREIEPDAGEINIIVYGEFDHFIPDEDGVARNIYGDRYIFVKVDRELIYDRQISGCDILLSRCVAKHFPDKLDLIDLTTRAECCYMDKRIQIF